MQHHLNTLYVSTDGAWLHKDGANIVVKVEDQEKGRLPAHMLGGIVCFGRVSLSSPLMGYCAEQGITISYLTDNGKFLARVEGPVSGNVLLRREQYRRSDQLEASARLARSTVLGKTLNQRAVVRRMLRDHGESISIAAREQLAEVEARLTHMALRLEKNHALDTVRGMEGEAALNYFGVFDHLIRVQKDIFRFERRSRRPPLDPVNALLSFLYTLLVHDCRSALETVGLDPAVGYLHRDRPGRPSLALDLMEEFRPVMADRLALSLINRKQLGERDFRRSENGAVLLSDDARKTVLVAYQERKRDEIVHPFLNDKTTFGLLPLLQARLLSRHLRGDLDGYPPFVWK